MNGDSTFFKTPAHFRKWFERNQSTALVLWVGFHKKDSGKPSLTWPEFQNRKEDRSRRYSYEQQGSPLVGEYERRLKANREAWKFWSAQAPGYQRLTGWWVMSAKKEETRLRRLDQPITYSANDQVIPPLARMKK
jgi:uncharacterized protein YdeI (YjbR/CyaY-like superfamily)